MTNANPSRLGQINLSGDTEAIFLKKFSGEVLVSFRRASATMGRHMVITIESGKSAQFPITGRTTASYHTPGAEILGDLIAHNERTISIDDLLLSSTFIPRIDEAMNHYETRSIYSGEMGVALATQMDKHVLQTMLQAAQETTALPNTEPDRVGTIITDLTLGGAADIDDDPDSLVDALFAAAQAMDEKDVPSENRVVYVKPKHYYKLANNSKAINTDFGNAGNGSTATGRIFTVAGIEVVKTNNLPDANVVSGVAAGDGDTRHAVDGRNNIGIVAHPSCVGTVKLLDLQTEMEYDIRRQGTLMVGKYAMGHGALRPESVVQLRTATP